ncbi:unsaturated glucuronyl hydrolase [Burkholderia alba]|uniref:unsaturated glucuronyl hydrolase n=1 Tax=Burkholderia alba TaxID=2683677 RepID=UPI002B0518D8|nr:unsaturated glucuronyl hydrolase [Burkholderia alba]
MNARSDTPLCIAPLTSAEIDAAIHALLARLARIDAQCGSAFPLYAHGDDDCWTLSNGGSWVGGFWAASWWRRARLTGDRTDRDKASVLSARLAAKLDTDSINRAMLFWYGAAQGAMAFGDPAATHLAYAAADAIAGSFDAVHGFVPVGVELGGGPDAMRRASVDTLAPLIQLLSYEDVPASSEIARRHTDALIAACMTSDGAWHAEAALTEAVLRPLGTAGSWSRGQAWAMLGLSAAAARWRGAYLERALVSCAYWRRTRPTACPPDRIDRADGPVDPSASLIAALAMLAVAREVDSVDAARAGFDSAAARVAALLRSPHYVRLPDGSARFVGACCRIAPDSLALVETAWSHFLLVDALCQLRSMSLQPRFAPAGTGPAPVVSTKESIR